MAQCRLFVLVAIVSSLIALIDATAGDSDPIYQRCVKECEKTGCVVDNCFNHCNFTSDGNSVDGAWYLQEPLYQRWKQWDCQTDCRYHCMILREEERQKLGLSPVKYHDKWPFHRLFGLQEPISVAFSALNLALQFHGWMSFFIIVSYKLPIRQDKTTYYEYTGLWHIYGILSMNSWLWSTVFHSRNVDLTEKFDFSSAVALIGYGLILALLRVFSIRNEAARVMVSAPLIAFVTTHILYLNLYQFDYGWNKKVCLLMSVAQCVLWAIWGGVSRHPARWKLWTVMIGGGLTIALEMFDFPPYMGFVDAHALSHIVTVPVTYILWSFVTDDAEFRTVTLRKKSS